MDLHHYFEWRKCVKTVCLMSYVRTGNSYVQKYIFFIRKRNNNSTNVSTNYSLLSNEVFVWLKMVIRGWILNGKMLCKIGF